MKNLFAILVLISVGCAGVNFQQASLYDVYEQHPATELTESVIFDDATGTMWNSLFECGDFEITNETSYSGTSSIKISWNKANCEWIGFGNSWNNWIPTDLSKDRYNLALSFYARTQEKTARAIPIVAALEDYGGGGSYHFIDAGKYLRGLELDTSWKQLIVPLWHFPVFEEEVDIASIKQMQFQLEGAGSYYLDKLEVIPYTEEEYAQHRAEVEEMRPKGNPNQTIYTEGKFYEDAWGHVNNECQSLTEETEENGNVCIVWDYKAQDCTWSQWGINWNDWYASNLRGCLDQGKISFRVKASEHANFKMILQDFRGNSADIITQEALSKHDVWQTITVPLSELELKKKNFSLDQIKQVWFKGEGKGVVCFDDIKIVGQ